MKMVSAAKLKKAQDAILQFRPYASKMNDIIGNLSSNSSLDASSVLVKERPVKKVLLIVYTSNRGLCGAFNNNVIKTSLQLSFEKYEKQLNAGNVHFVAIGKKGAEFLKGKKFHILSTHNELFDAPRYENVVQVADKIIELFTTGEYDNVTLIYNQFKNAGVQILTEEQLLPVKPKKKKDEFIRQTDDFIFEPDINEIYNELVPKSLKIQLYKALLDSFASEHGARMTAMHKATDNATEMIKDLTLIYNKARQAAITNEILEIVGGAEALKG
jgi:F-type H+-transporting ATPase subunit gamma